MMSSYQSHRGFTLIEVLIVMLVLVTVGSIILSIFVIALTGAAKTRNQQVVRENGNSAISQITRQIQYAKGFNYIQIGSDEAGTRLFDCTEGADTEYSSISVLSFDESDTIFACMDIPDTDILTIASQGASLINTNKVEVKECYFTCRQATLAESPTIGVYMELAPKNSQTNPIIFDASIVPRNF